MALYEHQPDFGTVTIAARPGNEQPDGEPVVLAAGCVCGDPAHKWEACVYPGAWRGNPDVHRVTVLQ